MNGTKRFGPALLLALPFLVALGPDVVDATRTIRISVSRYAGHLLRCETTFVNAD